MADGPRETPARPGLAELWQQAAGDIHTWSALLREHGYALSPGDEGYDQAPDRLPCGWPGKSSSEEESRA